MDCVEKTEIRVRTILGPDGEVDESHTVYCPSQHESKQLVDCEVCDRCVELRPDQPYLLCQVPADEPGVLVRIARRFVDRVKEVVTLSEVMTRDVVCVTPEFSLEALRALLLDRHISGVPVVDEAGFPIGVVSKTDLLREPRGATVRQVMMPVAFTLEESRPLADAIKLMATEMVHRLPIVDQSGRVVGLLSSLDLVRWLDG